MTVESKTLTPSIWYMAKGKRILVGLMSDFLSKNPDCWHITPVGKNVEKEAPLFVLETNDGLVSVHSPFKGRVEKFSNKAMNFPEQLTEEDIICEINLEPPKASTTTKKVVRTSRPALATQTEGNAFLQWPTAATPVTGIEQQLVNARLRTMLEQFNNVPTTEDTQI